MADLTWLESAVARNLRHLRARGHAEQPEQRQRYTQAAIARSLLMSDRAYANLENGVTPVRLDQLLHLAMLFAVSPIDLVLPAPDEDEVIITAAPQREPQRTIQRIKTRRFLHWWQGLTPLRSQDVEIFRDQQGRRRSDPIVVDARIKDEATREEGRRRKDAVEEAAPLSQTEREPPERRVARQQLERYWRACDNGSDEDAEDALEGLLAALETAGRRAEGDPHPERPRWNGKYLPLLPSLREDPALGAQD